MGTTMVFSRNKKQQNRRLYTQSDETRDDFFFENIIWSTQNAIEGDRADEVVSRSMNHWTTEMSSHVKM